jgi:hypothetical protein
MPGPLYHVGNTAVCLHGGQIKNPPSQTMVKVNGMPVGTVLDNYLIIGCALNVAGVPHPCLRATWITPATMVRIMGSPVMLQTSSGLTQAGDQTPQGAPMVPANQPLVKGV